MKEQKIERKQTTQQEKKERKKGREEERKETSKKEEKKEGKEKKEPTRRQTGAPPSAFPLSKKTKNQSRQRNTGTPARSRMINKHCCIRMHAARTEQGFLSLYVFLSVYISSNRKKKRKSPHGFEGRLLPPWKERLSCVSALSDYA